MDSEDDKHAINIETLEDYFYKVVVMMGKYIGAADEYGRTKQSYTIMKESDVRQWQKDDISRVATVLSMSHVAASILLCHYNWSVNWVMDAWFADECKVRRSVGLLEKPVYENPTDAKELTCGICYEAYPVSKIETASCGHPFCFSCWGGYIGTSINDGPGCLMLRCPEPACGAAVDQDMINLLASGKKLLLIYNRCKSVHMKKLSNSQQQSKLKLKFITDAWLQIVECRRILKWTYVYGYYLPDNEHAKKQLFEYLQGEAESCLERLHHCAEKEIQVFLSDDVAPSKEFIDFRMKLADLTSVTRNYFKNLVRALENGLSDVDSNGVITDDDWFCEQYTFENVISCTGCRMCN
ncbi:hypothetical protein TSUD_313070 [Trifolium subterraneum]|uniref:RBR-type E3 ubiquitin transferase n=1 Tax=Trifolium subterraneum TaxID=3900 RepID=A0A2Z6M9G1_TRISU|nr:hypothetical protein TSUD_313070 [Trifolium subterraneum]